MSVAKAKAMLGVAARRRDGLAMITARRELAVEKIIAAAERATSDAPPLRPEDVRRIVSALRATVALRQRAARGGE